MIPATVALPLYRGDTFRLRVTCWADAAKTLPADLTGATPTAQVRKGSALVAAFTCTLTPPNVIDLHLAAADTKAIPPSGCTWDLQLLYANTDVQTPVAGPVTVAGDVTSASA